jgi:propanol-preferring alcohol dehydrogenase
MPPRCCVPGIVGSRALKRAALPPGGRLGIYGFVASAHLAAQVALAHAPTVHVLTRSESARRHALELGAHSAGPASAAPPERLDDAILFALAFRWPDRRCVGARWPRVVAGGGP